MVVAVSGDRLSSSSSRNRFFFVFVLFVSTASLRALPVVMRKRALLCSVCLIVCFV